MTTLIAWVSIDQRHHRPSIWPVTAVFLGDRLAPSGMQVGSSFLCQRFPDIFGYLGAVLFPALVLGQITEAADSFLLFKEGDTAATRHDKFVNAVRTSFSRRHNTPDSDFRLVHGAREGSGSKAQFRIWHLTFSASTKKWGHTETDVSTNKSTLVAAFGSGAVALKAHNRTWESSEQGGTSRAIFSAFCDSIRSKDDPYGGGIPQVVGMYHSRMPQAFGIVRESQRYFHGY